MLNIKLEIRFRYNGDFKLKMRLYFVTDRFKSSFLQLKPRVPSSLMEGEDNKVPRICVCPSLLGCLTAIGSLSTGQVLQVYKTNSGEYYQPTDSQVPDSYLTGELWLLKEHSFYLDSILTITDKIGYHDPILGYIPQFTFIKENYYVDKSETVPSDDRGFCKV